MATRLLLRLRTQPYGGRVVSLSLSLSLYIYIYNHYMYRNDLVLNNLQGFLCHKTQPANQIKTAVWSY